MNEWSDVIEMKLIYCTIPNNCDKGKKKTHQLWFVLKILTPESKTTIIFTLKLYINDSIGFVKTLLIINKIS